MRDNRYQVVEDTTWPVDVDGEMQWALRYDSKQRQLFVASFLSAYAYLTDPDLTMKDATAALKRARKAHVQAATPTNPPTDTGA